MAKRLKNNLDRDPEVLDIQLGGKDTKVFIQPVPLPVPVYRTVDGKLKRDENWNLLLA